MNVVEFIERNAIWKCGIPLFVPSDALKLITFCEKENRKILGIDTFCVLGESIKPLLEESIDYSIEKNESNVWKESKEFIKAKEGKEYYYEIVYA